jgi:hypothetical protein
VREVASKINRKQEVDVAKEAQNAQKKERREIIRFLPSWIFSFFVTLVLLCG